MDIEKFTKFETVMAGFNFQDLSPILTGTAAIEVITGYDLGSTLFPIALPQEAVDDNEELNRSLKTLGFNRVGAEDDPVFYDGEITVAVVGYLELSELLGHQVPMKYIFEHRQPDYKVLTAFDLNRMFQILEEAPERPTEMQVSDLQKVGMLSELGYVFDRFPLRQMNNTHPLKQLEFHFATPKDYDLIDELVQNGFTENGNDGAQQVQLMHEGRARVNESFPNLEIIAKLGSKIVAYGMVLPAVLSSERQDSEWLVGVVGPLVVHPEFRGRGLGWRLQVELEVAMTLSTPAVMFVAHGIPKYWKRFGYVPVETTEITTDLSVEKDKLMVKELFPTVLETVDGTIYLPGN